MSVCVRVCGSVSAIVGVWGSPRSMAACLDTVLPYVNTREQFGQRIGEFQVCCIVWDGRRLSVRGCMCVLV